MKLYHAERAISKLQASEFTQDTFYCSCDNDSCQNNILSIIIKMLKQYRP